MSKVSKTKYAILGILNLKPSSGYDIKKFCDSSFPYYWNENFSHIYPMLKRMEKEGLITKETEYNEGKPPRNIYSITEKGKNEFFAWVRSPIEESPIREEGLLKLAMASPDNDAQIERAVQIFEEIKKIKQQQLEECLKAESALAEEDFFHSTEISFRLLALRWVITLHRAKIAWCEESLKTLKERRKEEIDGREHISKMALGTAYLRGYHAVHDNPRIFDDVPAYQFFTEEERVSLDQQLLTALQIMDPARAASFPDQAAALAWIMQSLTGLSNSVSRARYTEDKLEEAVRHGVKQYVILGAGIDTFVFRRPEIVKQLQVFEVDHPSMLKFKRSRLIELGWELPPQLHFVSVDFTQKNLAEALRRSLYDPQALTFFWLSVTYYLTRDEVFAILRTIADVSPTGSMVIFDYLDTDAFVLAKAAPRVLGIIAGAEQIDEPMKEGFDPSALATELDGLGLRLQENLSPSNIEERYFRGRTDNYHALEHVHYAYAVVE